MRGQLKSFPRVIILLRSLHSVMADDVEGFKDESALLKHELAYCLGQIRKESALPILQSVLRNKAEDPMVRHEVSLVPFILRIRVTIWSLI